MRQMPRRHPLLQPTLKHMPELRGARLRQIAPTMRIVVGLGTGNTVTTNNEHSMMMKKSIYYLNNQIIIIRFSYIWTHTINLYNSSKKE
jgi:hypothetical protein